jgi:hypothetical protein
VDQGGGVGREPAGQEERAVDRASHLLAVEEVLVVVGSRVTQPVDLVVLDRDRQGAGALPLAGQVEVAHVGLEGVKIGSAQPFEELVLLGPARPPVVLAVRQRRLAETAVAA